MAYDEKLAGRIREILGKPKGITERKMFGGLCFMLDGKMVGGVLKNDLVVKIGPENHNKAMGLKHVRSFDFTGKPMVGIVYVAPAGLKTKKDLTKWIEMGKNHAKSLPKKKKK
jgi:TfoX/Sxy family transcriptional regulator of competence genes